MKLRVKVGLSVLCMLWNVSWSIALPPYVILYKPLLSVLFGKMAVVMLRAASYHRPTPLKIVAEIQAGELIDKITILQLKMNAMKDPVKVKNVETELESLLHTKESMLRNSKQLEQLTDTLFRVNKTMWDIEDKIREKENQKAFDHEFIELARGVYITNDERCRIKRAINELVGSHLIEEKLYTFYKR